MTTTAISPAEVFNLLNKAQWTYTFSGDRVDERKMDTYIDEIECGAISEQMVSDLITESSADIHTAFEEQDINSKRYRADINVFSARFIADQVAQSMVNCAYDHVSFIALI